MALENFSFGEKWVGIEVADMKIIFFAIFDPTWAHILAPKKAKILELLKQNINFQFLRKTEVILLPSN